jgi:phage baseplate assembly protein W
VVEVAFAYRLDARGRTAGATPGDHILQMLEQLLFTRPGERVNRPDFGCGLLDLVFSPNSPELAAALDVTVGAAVARWLGDVIELTSLDVTAQESSLTVSLAYRVLATGAATTAVLTAPRPA